MNELSWLIYAGDVADEVNGLGSAAIVVSVLAVVVSAAALGLGAFVSADDYHNEDAGKPIKAFSGKLLKAVLPWCAALIVAGVVVPSKDTVYAIAASEMGERVIKSETGGKAVEALNAWLDRQIAGKPTE